MLSLDSARWGELQHAYGVASDIPDLLRQLAGAPSADGEGDPWFSLWSALAHQGDVYAASFAAVPHVIEAFARNPGAAGATYLQFPAWVEICRHHRATEIPEDLRSAYLTSLARLPGLVAEASNRSWDADFLSCALAALAAAKGQPWVAQAAMELSPNVAKSFLDWFYEQ